MTTRSIRRRLLLAAMASAIAGVPAHAASRRPTIGILVTDVRRSTTVVQFVESMREIGYADGRNITIRIASADGDSLLLPALANDLVRARVDVIFASGPAAIKASRDATSTIPIVALDLETDPVAAGWAASLARPGGNVTGLFLDLPAFAGKWIELLKEIDPSLSRLVLIWDVAAGPSQLGAAQAAARRLGVAAEVREVRAVSDIREAFVASVRNGVRGAVLLSSPNISQQSPTIASFAAEQRMLVISPFRLFPESGGLVSYGPRFDDFRRRGALFVANILKGAKPAELPIEQPTKFELVVNVGAARRLGIVVPHSILVRADEVVQ